MAELEVRELEQFVAVAEELHFGRAAARLLIAQPALSKTIRRLEARLGAPVLLRSNRQVVLTPAGEALLHHGRYALDAFSAAVHAARRTAEEEQLRLVIKPGGDAGLLSPILAEYATRPGAHRVEVMFSGGVDRVDHLRDGRADVALLFAPFDDLTGLAHETLRVEDRVAVLPVGHRLAARTELSCVDLDGETFPRWVGVPDDATGPEITDVPQMVHMIRLGRTVAMLPRSLIAPVPDGLVCVPVADAPASRMVIGWRENDRRPLVTTFVESAVVACGRS